MGNTSSGGKREIPMSPEKGASFDVQPSSGSQQRNKKIIYQSSVDEPDDYLPQGAGIRSGSGYDFPPMARARAATVSTGSNITPNALPTVFKWDGGGKNVYISGSFNNWKAKIPMVRSRDNFMAIVELPEGDHQYKYNVDGEWRHDSNQRTMQNEFGGVNNTVSVKRSDFEVFEALAVDSIGTGPGTSAMKTSQQVSGSPPGDYNQELPMRNYAEKTSGPPILPPHLLQVILNKDVPLQYEPSLLPEPNHVMLNHLYALSIKDGVMVLSATHRYRKKFITALFYKPI